MSINGNYGGQESYAAADPNASSQPSSISGGVVTNGSTGVPVPTAPSAGNPTAGAAEGNNAVPKDEVGWYFVEQYYTTLSRNPEKLHVRIERCCNVVSANDCSSFTPKGLNSSRGSRQKKSRCQWANV